MTIGICDLPDDLVGDMILSKVPVTSLREVRSTCKLWNRLSKNWIVGKATASCQHQFSGFMTIDFKVCSLRFPIHRKEEEELVALGLSIKQVELLNDQVEISKVFQCDGLLLCVARDNSKLVAWNPYLGQTRSIDISTPRTHNYYLFGCDVNGNHKILSFLFLDYKHVVGFEIYDFSSNSWRNLEEVRPDWTVRSNHRGVSLKGNTYFWSYSYKISSKGDGIAKIIYDWEFFLLCFDFTTERFGQRLPLPFHHYFNERTVTLSSIRDEKLAVLHQKGAVPTERIKALEIWVTTKIEPNDVSWSKFINVDMRPLIGDRCVQFRDQYGSFFIDEEEKVAVVFDIDGYEQTKTAHYHTAFIIGDDGYYTTVSLGEAPNIRKPHYSRSTQPIYSPPLVCSSSYLPSLVQLSQPRKRKERDEY